METTQDRPALDEPLMIIQPQGVSFLVMLQEIWRFRELIYFFAWRDVTVRYKQTVLGVMWAVLNPVISMIVFSVLFGNFAQIPSNGIPYPIFTFSALVPWTFLSSSLARVANSMVTDANMLKKVYFPRVILPISQMFVPLVDFMISFVVLILLMAFYLIFGTSLPGFESGVNIQITPNLIFLPLFLALAFVTALGIGLWLAALNVQFRDIRFATEFLLRIWMFLTPVIYPAELVGEGWRIIYSLNPMVGVIEGFRWALLGAGEAPTTSIFISVVLTTILLITGLAYFNRMEKTFADIV